MKKFRTNVICPNCKFHTVQWLKKIAKFSKPMYVCMECKTIQTGECIPNLEPKG